MAVKEVGALVLDGTPEVPEELKQRTQKYQQTRAATFGSWVPEGSVLQEGLLILTRFAETAQVHHVRAAGSNRRQLTFYLDHVTSPLFCPLPSFFDGFVFMKDDGGNERHQLYTYDTKTSAITLLTDGKSKNEAVTWSKKGDQFLYTSTERTGGKDYDIVLRSGAGFSTVTLLVDQGGGTYWSAQDWRHDDAQAIVLKKTSISDASLYTLDIATKELKQIHQVPEKISYHKAKYDPTPGATGIFLTSDEGSDFVTLKYFDLEKNSFVPLLFKGASGLPDVDFARDLAWDVETFHLIHNAETHQTWLALSVNEEGYSVLYLLNVTQKTYLKHQYGSVISHLRFNRKGTALAFVLDSPVAQGDVYVLPIPPPPPPAGGEGGSSGASGDAPVQWTFSEMGLLQKSQLVTPTLFKYDTFDGRKIPAFVYVPQGARPDEKLPVLIYIHGGPESQLRPTFSSLFQNLVSELRVALLVPNVRGSSGYGKHYLSLDDQRLREDSVKDIGALIDWVATQPQLDIKRVGVYGRSYGGYMVLASLIHFADRLKCGAESVGISNWVTFLENTSAYRRDLRRQEYGDERDPSMREFLLSISPCTHAHKLNKPLYVTQGLNDPRVPKSESDQIVAAVRKNGLEAWYLMAKNEGHGFAKKANIDYHNNLLLLFLQTYLTAQ